MLSRRKLLKTLSSVPVVGGLVGTGLLTPQLLGAAVT